MKKSYDLFNGFRVVMRRPQHPVKLGVYIETSLKEYEHFVAHIVDTGTDEEWVSYEIPINLMINNNIQNSMVFCQVQENFECKGITFVTESLNKQIGTTTHYIKKIDMIYNPDFYSFLNLYRIPVFVRSASGVSFSEQGYIDNGRHRIELKSEQQTGRDQMKSYQRKQSLNSIGNE